MIGTAVNRRRFERFQVPAQYTAVRVRPVDSVTNMKTYVLEGHAYDISEGGAQFELDEIVPAGTAVEMDVLLPGALAGGWQGQDAASERTVRVVGNVIWADDSEPGPARMALVFSRFANADDRNALIKTFASGKLRRAA